jgi:hypothetical protein
MSKRKLERAASVEVMGCTDPSCKCGDVGIIFKDKDGQAFAIGLMSVETALDVAEGFAREINAVIDNLQAQTSERVN